MSHCADNITRGCRKYVDGHVNEVSILSYNIDFAIYIIVYVAAMLVFGLWWSMPEYFTILLEILDAENVGIDTKTKSLGSLIREIIVIEWFALIR